MAVLRYSSRPRGLTSLKDSATCSLKFRNIPEERMTNDFFVLTVSSHRKIVNIIPTPRSEERKKASHDIYNKAIHRFLFVQFSCLLTVIRTISPKNKRIDRSAQATGEKCHRPDKHQPVIATDKTSFIVSIRLDIRSNAQPKCIINKSYSFIIAESFTISHPSSEH